MQAARAAVANPPPNIGPYLPSIINVPLAPLNLSHPPTPLPPSPSPDLTIPEPAVSVPAAYRSVFRAADSHDVGQMKIVCPHCQALHFGGEKIAGGELMLCCKKGDVFLLLLQRLPQILLELFTDRTQLAASFRKKIRRYNSALAFTSMNTGKDDRVDLRLLLTNVLDVKSFSEFYDFEGVTYEPYHAACNVRSLA